jgi:hypothetical protein
MNKNTAPEEISLAGKITFKFALSVKEASTIAGTVPISSPCTTRRVLFLASTQAWNLLPAVGRDLSLGFFMIGIYCANGYLESLIAPLRRRYDLDKSGSFVSTAADD